MIWIEEDEQWLRDLPALILAVMLHAALLSNAKLSYHKSDLLKPGSKIVAVEVVSALPARPVPPPPVTTAVAPVPEARKEGLEQPKKGPGPAQREQIVKPKTQLVAKRAQAGLKAPAKPKRKPVLNRMTQDQLRELALRKAQARMKAQALAQQRLQAKLVREERLRYARQRALELAAQRAVEKAEREAAAAAAREERRRLEAERRAEAARRAAEARAEKARQRAELKATLASMRDPDEVLSDAVSDSGPAGAASVAGSPRGRGTQEALVPMGDRLDAAAMEAGAEPVYEMEREGFDPINADASGGGAGPDGGGIGWSIDGPAGSRRIVKRVLPESPEWVSKRGLDLSVQLKFQIGPDGRVKPGAVIKRTSGFPEIDRRALDAIKHWRFDALLGKPGAGDAWGNVTFKFVMG